MTNEFFLSCPSDEATSADGDIARDLVDTLRAHEDECVGMAANMVGQRKRIIVFYDDGETVVMFNPEITSCDGPYLTREGCLSLEGTRPVRRFSSIEVSTKTSRVRSAQGATRALRLRSFSMRSITVTASSFRGGFRAWTAIGSF